MILLFKCEKKYDGPNTSRHNKSYGTNDDSVSILLDRIELSNNYNRRLKLLPRMFFTSIMIVLFLNSVIQKTVFKPTIFLQSVIVCFVIIRSLHKYTTHHYDKFSNYAILRNIKILRKKLNLKKGNKLSEYKKKFLVNSEAWNFTY